MTMIVSTRRDTVAVLAAESLHGRLGGPVCYSTKVVCHSSLPLAFAVGGCMWIPVGGLGAPAITQLTHLAATITSPDELILAQIADRVRQFIEPGLEEMQNTTQVFIALMNDGRADVGVQQVSASTVTTAPTRFWHLFEPVVPPSVATFYNHGGLTAFLHDPTVTDPESVGQRARSVIQQCIDHERTVNPSGQNEVIGGAIDVVLVTVQGARLLP
jgi:hypothetical protein